MDVLVTGGGGQLGLALAAARWPDGWRPVVAIRSELDIADPSAVRSALAARRFAAVVNAAAYTAVDAAESDRAAAWRANAEGPAVLARATAALGLPLVHVSTDYVFDGEKADPYVEDDATGPLSAYGVSKLAGEEAVRAGNPLHAIVRTSWVASPHGRNFVRTMLLLAAKGEPVRVVADQRGCPTSAADLATALAIVTAGLPARPEAAGLYHFANAGAATWFDLAGFVLAESARRGGPAAEVVPIATAEYPAAALRPKDSRLDARKIGAVFGVRPRPWRESMLEIVKALVVQEVAGRGATA